MSLLERFSLEEVGALRQGISPVNPIMRGENMRIVYLFDITFEYKDEFKKHFGDGTFVHGFYSKSADPKNIRAVANRYMKRHYIPARIVRVGEPQMKLQVKIR